MPDERLEEAILVYLKGLDSGAPVSPEQLAIDYPDVAAELHDFFADQASLDPMLAPLRQARPAQEVPRPHVLRSFGPYDLIEEVGRGGMGVIYKARHRGLDRTVALKAIRVGWLATPAEVQRFRNEAETVAALEHPHIVRIYDVGEHDGQAFFTMPWLDGGSLETDRRRWQADHRASARVVATAARALHHAHQRGILHRDVKPSNVLLDGEGRVYLADFGLSKRLDQAASLTETGAVVGTPGYLSPEQATIGGAAVTTASDIYGLGAVLYCLLAGRPPFRARTPLETISLVRSHEPRPPSSAGAAVDRDLEAICLKCLEKEPGRRYGSAEALAEDLERWLAGEPVQARKPGAAGRIWRWCRRNRAVAGMVASLTIVALAGVASLVAGLAIVNRARRDADVHRATAEDRAGRLREHLYAANIALGFKYLERDQAGELRQLLDQIAADGRPVGFEWHYLDAQVRARPREVSAFRGHTAVIYSVDITPDGKTVASCSEDRSIRLWDAATGALKLSLWPDPTAESKPHEKHLKDENFVRFSPDGGSLASCGEDGSVRLWDLSTRAWTPLLPKFPGEALCVEFSPDGRMLAATGVDRIIRLWDPTDGRHLGDLAGHAAVIARVNFSRDGRRLVSCDHDGVAKVWDLAARKESGRFKVEEQLRWAGFSPDGAGVVVAGRSGVVRSFRLSDGAPTADLLHATAQVRSATFSPDGSLFAASDDDGLINLVPVGGDGRRFKIPAQIHFAWDVRFSPDGRRLATSGSDRVARVFELPASTPLRRADPSTWPATRGLRVAGLAASPSGNTFALATGEGRVLLGDPRSDSPLTPVPIPTTPEGWIGFSPDGRELRLVEGDSSLVAWDLAASTARTLVPPRQLPAGEPLSKAWPSRQVHPVRVGRDGIGLLHGDGLLRMSGPGAGGRTLRPAIGAGDFHLAVASRDGQTLAVGEGNDGVSLRDRAGLGPGRPIAASTRATAAAFSDDGSELAIGGEDGTIRVVEVASGASRVTLMGHRQRINALAYAPDGLTLASVGEDGTARLWHVASGQELVTLERRPGALTSLAFSADGRLLVLAGPPTRDDASVRLYDAR